MACIEMGDPNIPSNVTWEELFDNDKYFNSLPHLIYEGEKYIAISEMSGSGGPSFYYEIDENNHINITSLHPSSEWGNNDMNSYWGYFSYKVTDLVLSEDKQSVSGIVRFSDGTSMLATFKGN